ncbi:PD-(D/E)XK nuclease-like domain-containing protein [Nocardiopsis dassonvillei]|uniref:PD-(D/E)XK nuclease-like domain-containing protein n=1 Tax=Nocardiopsis dassonvillei TaxID=2014 RepID=UPI00192D4A61|nr:PD-(D/E)XK nuclease-like domain-containing protein [Nocardiopsis dassonvillei]
MTATDERTAAQIPAITEPGVYDLPEAVYHADPVAGGSLSSTGARRLLECPALFEYERRHKRGPKKAFDIGSAAHHLVLGTGPEIVVIDADSYRTKPAKEQRDAAHSRDAIPLLPSEYALVEAMAEALKDNPTAARVFAPERGPAERSLFWQDRETGVWCRARLDHMPTAEYDARWFIVSDYKTTKSADPEEIAKAVYSYGYHIQAAMYLEAVRALGIHRDPRMVFVFQEKTAPYITTVVELDHTALKIGHSQFRKALALYKQCSESGHWPGYSEQVETISLPVWAERKHEEDM